MQQSQPAKCRLLAPTAKGSPFGSVARRQASRKGVDLGKALASCGDAPTLRMPKVTLFCSWEHRGALAPTQCFQSTIARQKIFSKVDSTRLLKNAAEVPKQALGSLYLRRRAESGSTSPTDWKISSVSFKISYFRFSSKFSTYEFSD